MATTSNEEIIEKSATAPIATSCLVIACVALIGAIAFQIAEIASYKTGVAEPAMTPRKGVAQDMADKYIAGLRKDVQAALDTSVRGGAAGLDRSFDRDLEPAPGDLPDEPADAMEEPEEEPADEPEAPADEPEDAMEEPEEEPADAMEEPADEPEEEPADEPADAMEEPEEEPADEPEEEDAAE